MPVKDGGDGRSQRLAAAPSLAEKALKLRAKGSRELPGAGRQEQHALQQLGRVQSPQQAPDHQGKFSGWPCQWQSQAPSQISLRLSKEALSLLYKRGEVDMKRIIMPSARNPSRLAAGVRGVTWIYRPIGGCAALGARKRGPKRFEIKGEGRTLREAQRQKLPDFYAVSRQSGRYSACRGARGPGGPAPAEGVRFSRGGEGAGGRHAQAAPAPPSSHVRWVNKQT